MMKTNIEWVGNIPTDWKLDRLEWHLEEVKETNKDKLTNQILSLTNMKGVIPYEEKGAQGNNSKDDVKQYKLAYPGTIVANSMNILIGSVGKCNYFGCVSPVYYVFKPKENENIDYLNYIFQSREFQKELRRYANGILEIRLRISASDILKRYVPMPSPNIQSQIVSILTANEEKIGKLILNAEKQIQKLKEYKQSLITKIITQGLDIKFTTIHTDYPWIGNINKNFRVCKLKYLLKSRMSYGANETGHPYQDGDYRYIRITDITEDGLLKDNDDNQYLSPESADKYVLSEGDVLFARSGGTVGKSFIYHSKYGQSSFAGYLIKAECDCRKIIPEYLAYFTQSSIYESWKNMIFIQATIQNIGANKYSNMAVVLGDINEQAKIIKYLDKKCNAIDNLIKIKKQKIAKLQEYKQSLIYEYVTGKREVKED